MNYPRFERLVLDVLDGPKEQETEFEQWCYDFVVAWHMFQSVAPGPHMLHWIRERLHKAGYDFEVERPYLYTPDPLYPDDDYVPAIARPVMRY